ncbi:MAG: Uma2 family endonuclease [Verrucomicrobiota bacterium]
MTLATAIAQPEGFCLDPGEVLLLQGSWEVFLTIEALCDSISPRHRVSFLNGTIEIMARPSGEHERSKTNIVRLVEQYFLSEDITFDANGEIRLKVLEQAGSEPDECYYINRIGNDDGTEFPDIVLEVKVTSGGLDRLDVWAAFSIPEVWIHEKERLRIFLLEGSTYREAPSSRLVPHLPIADVEELCQIRPTSSAIRELLKRIGSSS